MIRQDEMVYLDGEAPDLGSITPIKYDATTGTREYRLLSKDKSKLNSIVTYCGTGSTAYCVDTGEFLMFHTDTKQWYEQ